MRAWGQFLSASRGKGSALKAEPVRRQHPLACMPGPITIRRSRPEPETGPGALHYSTGSLVVVAVRYASRPASTAADTRVL
jgi:hypothetical protein